MKKVKLATTPVVFDKESHTYTIEGEIISGITSIIGKYICPKKYDGVDKETLHKAALHGSQVHSQIESWVNDKWSKSARAEFLDIAQAEVHWYLDLIKKKKIKMLCAEYLVSDAIWVASSIDLVDTDLNLYDIKTTSELDKEYVRWQLSIYAYLFEYQNPDLKAGKLYAIHLRDGAKLVEVERIPDEIIRSLLFDTYAKGLETFDNPLNSIGDDEDDIMMQLKEAQDMKKAWEEKEKAIRTKIESIMRERGTYSIKKSLWSITRGIDSFSTKFDDKAFKEAKPKMWEKFLKQSKVKGKLTITFKSNDNEDDSTNL